MLWARIAGPRADAGTVDRHRTRLREFLTAHQYFFGSDGAPVHQGRSLTYRFAAAAPLWAGALADATPLPPGRTRRLASGTLKHFAERGAPDEHGLLSLGWYRPFLPVIQRYSGPASPYWASKGFLGLLLPPDHEVWTAPEEPGPAERADAVTPIAAPNWLLQSTSSDGLVRLHNHGSEDVRYDPYYTRLAYSTVTAPSPSYDNSVIVGDDPSRTGIEPLGVGDGWVASRHAAGGGARVTSGVRARGAVEVRAHLVSGAESGTPVRVTGWAARDGVLAEAVPAVGLDGALTGVTGEGGTLFVALVRLTGDADPVPLDEAVTVRADGAGELTVRWRAGAEVRVRLDDSEVSVVAEG